ncbi:MAG: hypothetical protein KC609_18450 [Myxococcales bacterium]|nr:hypothetical protein [Myxococcales bacterium]
MKTRTLSPVVSRALGEAAIDADQLLERARVEAEDVRRRAQEEGYEAGYREGQSAGLAAIVERCCATPREANDDALVIELALALARQIVQREIELDPHVVRDLVGEHLASLQQRQGLTVVVHPDDLALIREYLATREPLVAVESDDRISRGGCRLEAPDVLIDATLETRFELLRDALARV